MKIEENMIASKEVVGKTSYGSPVVMIVTYGGLYAFFSKNSKNDIETLGMAPHKAIAAWMAEKKIGIEWSGEFKKYEETELEDLKKGKKQTFIKLRDALFSNALIKSNEKSDYYIIYDTKTIQIGVMHKSEIQRSLDRKEIYRESFVRNLSLNEPVEFISKHPDFSVGSR